MGITSAQRAGDPATIVADHRTAQASDAAATGPGGQPAASSLASGTADDSSDEQPDNSDSDLIAAFKGGDKLAFQTLVQKYEARVYNLCMRMVNDETESQDLTQEVFLKVYRSILRYQHTYSFYTWVYRITVNCCIDYMRKRKRKAQTVSLTNTSNSNSGELGRDQDVPDTNHVPDTTMEKNELREILNHAISQLSAKLQSIIILKEIEGFTYEEIAEILNCSRGTVKSRLFRARARLKELLSPYVGEYS